MARPSPSSGLLSFLQHERQFMYFFCFFFYTHLLEHYLLLFNDRVLQCSEPLFLQPFICVFIISPFLFPLFPRRICKPKSAACAIIKLIWFHSDDSSGETESSKGRKPLVFRVIHRLRVPPLLPRAGVLINVPTSWDPWRHGRERETCFSPQNTQTQEKFMLTDSLSMQIGRVIHDKRGQDNTGVEERRGNVCFWGFNTSMRRFQKLKICL